ncbi:MAG: hypothetical protein LKM36_14110 [Flavobacteriales bacterium]|jgi:hypothetical protein|nr:hypothetical protein [Flavobacteriales bacterium]
MRSFTLEQPKILAWITIIASVACMAPAEPPAQHMESGMVVPAAQISEPESVPQQPNGDWHPVENNASAIAFSNGDTLRFPATGLRYMDKVTAQLGREWYLFSGKDTSAKGIRTLYVESPGYHTATAAARKWEMPGRLLDHDGSEVYYEAEVFAGEVLPDTVGVAWYDRSLMPDGQWRLNTTLLIFGQPQADTLVLFGHLRKSVTQRLAFQGKCRLLKGEDQLVKP